MKLKDLQEKLIQAARDNPPVDHVPYAFEKRISALVQDRQGPGCISQWVRGLWRGAMSSVAIALLCGIVAFILASSPKPASDDLSQNFENTLLASVDQGDSSP